jgi:hypothetical protein
MARRARIKISMARNGAGGGSIGAETASMARRHISLGYLNK